MNQINEKLCPFCGKNNGCMVDEKTACWCYDFPIPEELREYIPLEKRMKACVCKDCMMAFIKNREAFLTKYVK